MLLFDFDTIERRKRFFWICFAVSLVIFATGIVVLGLSLNGDELKHALLSEGVMVLAFDVSMLCSVLWPGSSKHSYAPRISMGKFRLERSSLPDDTEGLRFSGYAPVCVLFNLFAVLTILGDYVFDFHPVASTLCIVFGFVALIAAIVIICLTTYHIQKHYKP